jgi:tetratricopeptide (TPR) repeat protein
MRINVSIWQSFRIAGLAFSIFVRISALHAAVLDDATCFDANAVPSIRVSACTQIIDATDTSNQVRLTAYFNRAAANYLDSKLNEAIQDYSYFISVQPSDAAAFHERGLAYLKSLRISEAIADFSKAIRINPNYSTAYNNRGLAYVKNKDNQKALSDFNIAIQLDPSYATALYNRSIIRLGSADYDSAISDLKKAIEVQPYNQDFYNQLAWVYLKSGMALEGLPYANKAIEIKASANYYDTRGAIYEAIGSATKAIEDYNRALSLDHSFSSSAQALKRLLAKTEAVNENTETSVLISELIGLVKQNGRLVDLGRMCALMKLNSQHKCMFRQIALSSDVPNVIDSNGFNVPDDKNPQFVVIYSFQPLVGNFFVVSSSGTLKAAFFRAKGIDYSEVPLADVRHAFDESIKFWKANLVTIKNVIAAGDIKK